jgi:hypothetical protein
MIKRIIFTAVLLVIGAASVYFGNKPIGPLAAWQDQSSETERGIQKRLSDKSDQIINVWGNLNLAHGTINIMLSTDVKSVYPAANPVDALIPINNILSKISGLFRFSLGTVSFEKMLLTVSVILIFVVLIPLCAIISIYHVWTSGEDKQLKVVIAAALTGIALAIAIPAPLMLASIADNKIFNTNEDALIGSMEEINEKTAALDNELKRFRRTDAAITEYITSAKDISNAIIKVTTNYIIVFLMIYVLFPVLLIIVIYKAARFSAKKIVNS